MILFCAVSRTLRNLLGRMNTSHSTNVMTVETRRNQEDQKNVTSFQKKTFCTAKSLLSLVRNCGKLPLSSVTLNVALKSFPPHLLQRDAKVERTRLKTLRKSITKARGNMLLVKRRRVKKQVLPAARFKRRHAGAPSSAAFRDRFGGCGDGPG